jgi:peptidoglycan/LPS O-acetylase OafA/YrhL
MVYRPFGAVRFGLALLVVMGHAAWLSDSPALHQFEAWRFASAAVLAFFILSGFVITEAATTYYRDRPGAFVVNRALKILPAFVGALFVSVALHLWLTVDGRLSDGAAFLAKGDPQDVWGASSMLVNILSVLPLDPDFTHRFVGHEPYLFVRYIWAVGVECLFYAAVAVSILAVTSKRVIVWGLPAALLLYVVVSANHFHQFTLYFLLGVLLFFAVRDRAVRLYLAATLVGVLLAPHALAFTSKPALLGLAVFAVALIGLVYVRIPASLQTYDRRLGDLSYTLYLNHFVVLVVFSAYVETRGAGIWVLAIVLSVALAALAHIAFERPVAALRASVRKLGVKHQLAAIGDNPAAAGLHADPNMIP